VELELAGGDSGARSGGTNAAEHLLGGTECQHEGVAKAEVARAAQTQPTVRSFVLKLTPVLRVRVARQQRACELAVRARAVPARSQADFSFRSFLLTDPIEKSFLVASSPSLCPRSTNCGCLDGGFVPRQWQSDVVLRHSGARCKR
jgi:hypothetical protein